ncbi:MAG: septal ring lytic transglycosylase RlpA family protein [Ignavibacteriaceae bacterium]|nr:septal ring lytic transglycosylase RlpA family protein [Ignavibacteriaceae bacterium]
MKKLFILVIPFFLVSCTSTLRYSKENNAEEENSFRYKRSRIFIEPSVPETLTGIASYYADEFDGKKTANGEIFNMNDLTAAHISYPFNTTCRVTNLKNQKSVIVRINDRKPDTNNRAIDLSLGAAKEIDMVNDGLVEVRIDILEWGGE